MKLNFIEKSHVIHCATSAIIAANEDMFDGGWAGDVISMANADSAVFLIVTNANASGGQASVYVNACDDTTPTTTAKISFYYKEITSGDTQGTTSETKEFATSTGANCAYVVEVPAAKVAEYNTSYEYIQLQVTEKTNQAVDGGVIGFLTGLRFASDAESTQLT